MLRHWQTQLEAFADLIPVYLPFVAGLLGYAMISNRLRYIHVAGRLITRRTFDAFAYVIFGLVLLALFPEITLPCVFVGYLFSAPIKLAYDEIRSRKARSGASPD